MIERTEQEIIQNWKGDINTPLVSVCTITYNHEKYVAEALDSFLMQETDFSFEIVIADDCSPDKTAEVIKQYMKKYPHIIKDHLREKNVGMVINFTENIKRANGKYIAICEGDDYWTDTLKLQKQVDFLEENDEYVITYSSVEAFDENGIVKDYVGGVTRNLEKIELQRTTPINTPTTCFRNVVSDIPKEFQCTKYGDLFMWSLLGIHGKGKFLTDILPTRYRVHDGGVHSKKTREEQFEMFSLTCAALYLYHSRIGNIELAEHFKRNIFEIRFKKLATKKIIKRAYKEVRNRIKYKVKNFFKKSRNA